MTLYLCHNCSDINSQSGEACIMHAENDDGKEEILHGSASCQQGYQSLVSPTCVLHMDTDFYIVGSEEGRRNYQKVMTSPLWIVNNCHIETEVGYLKTHPEHETLFKKLGTLKFEVKKTILEKYNGELPPKAFSWFIKEDRKAEIERITQAAICKEDPLTAGWKA